MRTRSYTASLALLSCSLLLRASGLEAQNLSAITDKAFKAWSSPDGPGCVIGIDRAGQPRFIRAYGAAELENGTPNRPTTIFEAGSVSKQFTAAATVLLALDGKINLDDDVRKYIPELPRYERTITIRHLLNHTSGLRDWGEMVDLEGWPRTTRVFTMDHVLEDIVRQRVLNYPPGDKYAYTNSGYNLLAIIVARVSGQSFMDFTHDRIFAPLGMTNTQWRDDYTRLVKGRAQAYERGPNGQWVLNMPFEKLYGNSSLLTNVSDLLTWTHMLEDPPAAWRALRDSLHVRGVLTNGDTSVYAMGLVLDRYRGVPIVEHNGATAGYRADLARYPGKGLAIAMLCNAADVNPRAPVREIVDVLLAKDLGPAPVPASPRPKPAPWAPTAADLAAVTGTYYSAEVPGSVTVSVSDGKLMLFRAPATRIILTPTTTDHYAGFGTGPNDELWFTRRPDGRATAMHVRTVRAFDVVYDRQP